LAKFSEMGINVVETKRRGVRKRWRLEELEDDERKWKARTS